MRNQLNQDRNPTDSKKRKFQLAPNRNSKEFNMYTSWKKDFQMVEKGKWKRNLNRKEENWLVGKIFEEFKNNKKNFENLKIKKMKKLKELMNKTKEVNYKGIFWKD